MSSSLLHAPHFFRGSPPPNRPQRTENYLRRRLKETLVLVSGRSRTAHEAVENVRVSGLYSSICTRFQPSMRMCVPRTRVLCWCGWDSLSSRGGVCGVDRELARCGLELDICGPPKHLSIFRNFYCIVCTCSFPKGVGTIKAWGRGTSGHVPLRIGPRSSSKHVVDTDSLQAEGGAVCCSLSMLMIGTSVRLTYGWAFATTTCSLTAFEFGRLERSSGIVDKQSTHEVTTKALSSRKEKAPCIVDSSYGGPPKGRRH